MTTNGQTSLISKHMPATRRRILTLLKENGSLTADELSDMLGISAVAVRRHLTKLESDHLVTYEEVQRGMGRPSFVYRLGDAAASFFPRGYEELAVTVLETIQDLYGSDAVEAIFRVRADQILENYRRKMTGTTLDTRLAQFAELREADGYMSDWQTEGNGVFILREANCPIVNALEGCGSACDHDLNLISTLLDADVTRVENIASGDGACVYHIRAKTASN